MDQSIMCLYFQSQQQSYLVNRHNRQHPQDRVEIDDSGQWQDRPVCQDSDSEGSEECDPHNTGLSEYERQRQQRVRRNDAMVDALGLRAAM